MKRLLLFGSAFSPLLTLFCSAQSLTGIWRGTFFTEDNQQYRFEVQIDHQNNSLSGVTYSYLDKSFYGKAIFTGNFNTGTQNALVQEIKTVEVRMSSNSMSCIQKCLLTYTKSGREEFLEGTFTSVFEKSDSLYGYIKGEDCGGGSMILRKVPTSDFYIEPFLRKKNNNNTTPVVKNNPPATKPPVVKNQTPPKKNPVTTTISRPVASNKPVKDTAVKADLPDTKKEPPKNIIAKSTVKTPAIINSRETDLVQTLVISAEDVTVKLYDNGEIDDDTISVYLDNKLVLSKKRLTASALTISLKMDESSPDHELIMVAENLGRIPPNTSLMIVNAGDKRHEVRITSSEQKNAMVRFKYIKPGKPK